MKKNPVGTLIVLVAAVISCLAIFLPFYSVDIFGEKLTVSLFNADGVQVIAIVWLAFIALALIFALAGKKALVLVFGILSGAGLFLSYTINNGQLKDLGELGSLVDKGIGNTLTIVGAVCMLAAGIIYAVTTKAE
jgi:nucleoside recognition membrane protein YjiH